MGMATFVGITQKCTACDKTVYLVDQLTADDRVYHKACLRCHHCNGTLMLINYSTIKGVLYYKPHFDQLFKRTGSLDRSFEGTREVDKASNGRENWLDSRIFPHGSAPAKIKYVKKVSYPIEKVAVDGAPYTNLVSSALMQVV